MNARTTVMMASVALALLASATLRASEKPTIVTSSASSLSADEAAKCLGGYLWQLDMKVPPSAKRATAVFQLAKNEKDAKPFAAGVTAPLTPNLPLHLLVAVVPLGRDIRECDEIRVTIIGLDNWSSTVEKNPFRGSKGVGKPATPEDGGNGRYHLMGSFAGEALPASLLTCDQILSLSISVD